MSRHRSKDFEAIYLHATRLRRCLPQADLKALSDPEVQKIIKSSSNRYFNMYKGFLKSNGFDFDDMKNLVTLWALAYTGSEPAGETWHYGIMTTFIRQRCNFFIQHIGRHFDSNDSIVVSFKDCSGISLDGNSQQNSWSTPSNVVMDDESHEAFLENGIYLLEGKINRAQNKRERAELTMDQRIMMKELEAVRKKTEVKLHEFNKNRRETLMKLRALFEANPHKYSNQLSYYATTKHVAKDVRKKARFMCDKYGIDYKEWLKNKLEDVSNDSIEFDCT